MPKNIPDKEKAVKQLESALKLFNSKKFSEAKESLKNLIEDSPQVGDVVQLAEDYLRICENRLSATTRMPKDSKSKYMLAVYYLNIGDLEEAERHVKSAAGKTWKSKHLYLMALIQFEKKDVESGLDYLKKAIKKDPEIRIVAYNNPDLFPLHKNPEFKKIVSKK